MSINLDRINKDRRKLLKMAGASIAQLDCSYVARPDRAVFTLDTR